MGVTGDCELLDTDAGGITPGLLEEQQALLLTIESSSQQLCKVLNELYFGKS